LTNLATETNIATILREFQVKRCVRLMHFLVIVTDKWSHVFSWLFIRFQLFRGEESWRRNYWFWRKIDIV